MTTITINSKEKISKTNFENLDELSEYIYQQYLEKELPPLNSTEIKDAREAKKEINSKNSSFRPVK